MTKPSDILLHFICFRWSIHSEKRCENYGHNVLFAYTAMIFMMYYSTRLIFLGSLNFCVSTLNLQPISLILHLPVRYFKIVWWNADRGWYLCACNATVHERVLRTCDDFVWPVDTTFLGRLIIDVEFLDLKIYPLNVSL